jgi:hypothetical protein
MTSRIPIAAAIAALVLVALAGSVHAGPYRAPRTAFGQPDLQGLWTAASLTELERDSAKDPLTFATPAQEAAFEAAAMAANAKGEAGGLGQGVSEWHPAYRMARLDGKLRTSWITSPADGQLPYRPEALKRFNAIAAAARGGTPAANPEDRTPADRCLVGGLGSANPPMVNPPVAAGKQIVQTGAEVAILSEMNHDLRIVRLGTPGHPAQHPPANVRVWMGDSIGHWQGDTLVVETTNFHPDEGWRGYYMVSPDARVTERFTRTARHEIRYAFEVDDPATFTEVWRGEMPLLSDPGPIYEFACHEGNYSMPLMLSIARAADAAGAGK